MKTIKLLVLGLLSTLFLSCSENYDDNVFIEPDIKPTVKRITHHYKQYYEKPIVINRFTNDDEIYGYDYDMSYGIITLGRVVFQQRYRNNQVIDTLTIDLTSYNVHHWGIKEIRLFEFGTSASDIEFKYATINYLNIIGLDKHPNLKIIGDGLYDKIEVYNSNVPVDKLNSISGQRYGQYDMFEKVDHERKEWSSGTYVLDKLFKYKANNGSTVDGYVGFIGYRVDEYRNEYKNLKLEIVDITEHYD